MSNSNEKSNTKPKGRPPAIIEDWAPKFIGALMEGATITDASKAAGVHITMPYKRRVEDIEFRKAWNDACEIGTELLEQEAIRRAYHGIEKSIYYKGVEVGTTREYSDPLMQFILKGRKPHVYREGIEEGSAARGLILNVQIVQHVEQEKPNKVVIDSETLPLNLEVKDGKED